MGLLKSSETMNEPSIININGQDIEWIYIVMMLF